MDKHKLLLEQVRKISAKKKLEEEVSSELVKLQQQLESEISKMKAKIKPIKS